MKDFNFATVVRDAEKKVVSEMRESGRVIGFDFSDDTVSGKYPIAEMIGTPDGAAEFLEKIVFDLATGQAAVPLTYRDIYSTQTDPSFPETFTTKTVGNVQTVFLEKFEGGEIKFGSFGGGKTITVQMHTYGSGIEYDEDIQVYNQTWRVAAIGESFGRSYNQLLNHLHLDAIVSASYAGTTTSASNQATLLAAAKAQKGYVGTDGVLVNGVAQKLVGDISATDTWQAAMQLLPRGTVILHNAFDALAIQGAFAQDLLANGTPGPVQRHFSNVNFVSYDGDVIVVGSDVYEYDGVPQGTAFLLVPKTNFTEYVKHDLRVDSGDGDLSRLVLAQVVGRTRRGLIASVGGESGAIKIAAS